MRILYVTPFYTPVLGGAQIFQQAMAGRLAAAGHQVQVLTTVARAPADFWQPPPSSLPTLSCQDTCTGVSVRRLPLAYPRPAPYVFGILRRLGHWMARTRLPETLQQPLLLRLARSLPPLPGLENVLAGLVAQADLVQATDSSWDGLFTAAAQAASQAGKPLVAVPLMHLGDEGVRRHFQMVHQVDVYRRAHALVALSAREAAAYAALGARPQRVHLLSMGVEAQRLVSPNSLDVDAFRRRHHLDGPVIAFLGANTYDKGAFSLALAVSRLNQAGLDIRVVYAGPQEEGLRSFLSGQPAAVRRVLADRLHILGQVDEETKHGLLSACDALALPSQVDTFGIVLLEAWQHGKPVIGAAAGGIPDLIVPDENGLLVPFDDVPALAAALRRLIQEPDLAARMGAAGRSQVLRQYTWDHTFAQLLPVYRSVLETDAPRLHRS